MKHNLTGLISILITVLFFSAVVFSQTTEFTYQGSLKNSSVAANGNYDFEFALFDALAAGTQIGSTLTRSAVAVADGNFSVKLDFGAQFPGANRYLEIRVRTSGAGAYTTLTPRQSVNSTPYSVQSLNATNAVNATNATTATTATNATQLGGLSSGSFIQNTTSLQPTSNFNISGNGYFGGNVGVGTTAPEQKLHVVGTEVLSTGAQSGFKFRDRGSSSAADDWVWYSLGNIARFYRAGTGDAVAVQANGNFGIGSTAPAKKLVVGGGTGASGVFNNGIFVNIPGGAAMTTRDSTSGVEVQMNAESSGIGTVGTFTNHPLNFRTNNVEAMRIFTDGRVAIGVPDSGAAAKLNVVVAADNYFGILTRSTGAGGFGLLAEGETAVQGQTAGGTGIVGLSGTGVGIKAQSSTGTALQARSSANLVEGYNNLGFRKFHIDVNGTYTAGSDFAEALPASGKRADYEPGDVLVVSTKAPGKVEKTSRPYDTRVAGIYSTRPGMLGADKNGISRVDAADVPVAIVGIVPTKVSAADGRIRVGDLLTTSSTPGYAMRCSNRVKCVGAVVGKAMEPLAKGTGVIKVLVMLR